MADETPETPAPEVHEQPTAKPKVGDVVTVPVKARIVAVSEHEYVAIPVGLAAQITVPY